MVAGKYAEDSRVLDEERVVRTFLEQAASIILESRTLDGPRFDSVLALADELGLSREQLACELRLLEQRGVISSAPWERLEPSADAATAPGKGDAAGADDAAPEQVEAKRVVPREQPPDAARVAPVPPVPPGMPRAAPPPVRAPDRPTRTPSVSPQQQQRFRQLAGELIATQGSLTPTALRLIQLEGNQLGLTQEQIEAAIASLADNSTSAAAPPPTTQPPAPPSPLPSQPSPSESFRRWLKPKLAGYPSAVLAAEDEQGLVGVGVHRYKLAKVLATHLVRDVATERDMRLERDLEIASCHSTVGASASVAADDQKLKEFFERVAPILTQHRGINAKSRVMMNAIAEQIGLSPDELERAIATLQRAPASPVEDDPRQVERRESFRRYLRRAMAQLPHGIVTFKTERRLMEAGEHFHGVASQSIKPTINEVASEMGVRFISEEQAIEHITTLVDELLAQNRVMGSTTRSRVYAEGTRWGLDPIDVEAILRQQSERVAQRMAAERKLTRWILTLVISVISVVALFLLWMLVPSLTVAHPEAGNAELPQKVTPTGPPPETDWWDDELRIAMVNARRVDPDLKSVLEQIGSPRASAREQAYEQLARRALELRDERTDPEAMQPLLARLYALEPEDRAARQLPETLLQGALSLEDQLPGQPQAMAATFWGCQTAAAMLKASDLSATRAAELTSLLESAVHQVPDRFLELDALQRQCGGALAQRYYRLLTRSAAGDPARAGRLYRELSRHVANCLDDVTRDRLDVDFLAAILPAVKDQWDDYHRVIERLATAKDATVVIKLLNIFRDPPDPLLRNYLAALFLERLGADAGSMTESELIEALQKSLGVATREKNIEQWNRVTHEAEELLNRRHVEGTNPDVLLQESLDLAHLATLTCALAQNEHGEVIFEQLQTKGPVHLETISGPWRTETAEPLVPRYPLSTLTLIHQYIGNLENARTREQHIGYLRLVANQTESVDDINPAYGAKLAEYLMEFKPDEEEHRQMLLYATRLAKWNSVRLGLADQLEKLPGRDSQMTELLSNVLGEPISLDSEAGRVDARRKLLSTVLANLVDAPETDNRQWQVFDQGSAALAELYATQARLLGVAPDSYPSAGQPAPVIRALIQHVAENVDATKLEARDRQFVADLPVRLNALDFVAANDIQNTAMLEAVWLRLLALQVVQARPDKAVPAREIMGQLPQAVATRANILEQLRDQQAGLLRLWLLYRPEEADGEPASTDI